MIIVFTSINHHFALPVFCSIEFSLIFILIAEGYTIINK